MKQICLILFSIFTCLTAAANSSLDLNGSGFLDGKRFCRSVEAEKLIDQKKTDKLQCVTFADWKIIDDTAALPGYNPEILSYWIMGYDISKVKNSIDDVILIKAYTLTEDQKSIYNKAGELFYLTP